MNLQQTLGQIFENHSNCYADTTDESVVLAMDKTRFTEIVERIIDSIGGEVETGIGMVPVPHAEALQKEFNLPSK